jgi:curli biogenesis system outer membrane secretion channel CsgG
MKRPQFVCASASSLFLAMIAPALSASPRVAVAVESDGTLNATQLTRFIDQLTGALLQTNHYEVVDRSRLAAVIREQGFSNSSYADPAKAAALGKIVGASRILHVTISLEASNSSGPYLKTSEVDITASYTMVGVDSARIVKAGTAEGSARAQYSAGNEGASSPSRQTREAIDDCVNDLVSQLDSHR